MVVTTIYGIMPQQSSLGQAIGKLGNNYTQHDTEMSTLDGDPIGGSRVVKYSDLGVYLVIDRDYKDNFDPLISSVYVEEPFNKVLSNGLYLGISKAECIVICSSDYVLNDVCSTEEYLYFDDPVNDNDLQLWFKFNILQRVSI